MKKLIQIALFCSTIFYGYSQDKQQTASVEKFVYGIQTGLAGFWIHGEFKVSNKFALRVETGLDLGIWENQYSNEKGIALMPVLALEPRFYYNLNKRVKKGKRIDGNSGNFITIKTTYYPDLFVIGTNKDLTIISDLSIIPTWGIRRNIGKHFNYEAGFGIGYIHYIDDYHKYYKDRKSDVGVNLHARIGYKF